MMRAALIDVPGPAEAIELRQLPAPKAAAGEVLVRVAYSCVNHVDTFVRSGAYVTALPSPFIIGRDLVGFVEGSGPGVNGFSPGDRVWSNSMGYDGRQGAFSELCAVPADRLFAVPEHVRDLRDVVALGHAFTTAWLGLGRTAPIEAGQAVFIGGAAGAVGSAAVQYAAARGARVLASAAPPDHAWVASLGAEHVFDYSAPDVSEQAAAQTAAGVDLWWDTSGHQELSQLLPALAIRGRVLVSAGLRSVASVPTGALYTRDASVRGFAVSNASTADLAHAAHELNGILQHRRLDYRVSLELPLSHSAEAHRLVEAGGLHGKVLVRVGD